MAKKKKLDAKDAPRQEIQVDITIGLWVNANLTEAEIKSEIKYRMLRAFNSAWHEMIEPMKSFKINELREERHIYETCDSDIYLQP